MPHGSYLLEGDVIRVFREGNWVWARVVYGNRGSITSPNNLLVRVEPDQGYTRMAFWVEPEEYNTSVIGRD